MGSFESNTLFGQCIEAGGGSRTWFSPALPKSRIAEQLALLGITRLHNGRKQTA
ncbi:hypothetical protein ACFYY1_15805 [Streptomyces sp. NPDC001890]|uniref:hypothetical protein n=1 Tax=Streptomyces sp. NPDC001890 TaxID=3364620 RepID=UPI00369026A6